MFQSVAEKVGEVEFNPVNQPHLCREASILNAFFLIFYPKTFQERNLAFLFGACTKEK
jgi:hypothetical protein